MGVSINQKLMTHVIPSETFLKATKKKGAKIIVHDPYVRYWKEIGIKFVRVTRSQWSGYNSILCSS